MERLRTTKLIISENYILINIVNEADSCKRLERQDFASNFFKEVLSNIARQFFSVENLETRKQKTIKNPEYSKKLLN